MNTQKMFKFLSSIIPLCIIKYIIINLSKLEYLRNKHIKKKWFGIILINMWLCFNKMFKPYSYKLYIYTYISYNPIADFIEYY